MSQAYKISDTKITSPYPVQLTPAETRLVYSLQDIFDPSQIFVDCYFPKPDSKPNDSRIKNHVVSNADLIQIDCLAVDERGIFVFESKGHLGWIYGHGDRIHWTQVSAYGKNKHQFYSPVRQNAAHVAAIASIFGTIVPLYSIVVFGGDVTLKVIDNLPPDCHVCTQAELADLLVSLKSPRPPFSPQQVSDICTRLRCSSVAPSTSVRDEHIQEIEDYKIHD